MTSTEPIAEWTPDCNGKWDYDAPIVELSSRYWPRGGGYMTFDTRTGEFGENADRPEIKPHAHSAIILNGETVAEADFEGETEEIVKAQVEAWAAMQVELIKSGIRAVFNQPIKEDQ